MWYCAESDSAQYDTARSQQLKFTADPKVSNTARSRTSRSVMGSIHEKNRGKKSRDTASLIHTGRKIRLILIDNKNSEATPELHYIL